MASDNNPSLLFRQGFSGFVTSDLYEAALAGKGTDMKFEIGNSGTLLNAHSSVIRTQSKVLDVMLNETWTPTSPKQQKEEIVLKLPDDPQEFQLFLKYLYGNQELNGKNFDVIIPVWKLADKYGADNLLALFVEYFEFLKLNFDKINVAKLLPIAHKHRCEVLLDAAMDHVKGNLHMYWNRTAKDYYAWPVELMTDILSTDSLKRAQIESWELNEMWILYHTGLWLTQNRDIHNWSTAHLCEVATQVLENIRFCQLDHAEFKKCVRWLFGILEPEQVALITFAYSGVPDEQILKFYGPELGFKVDRRLRHPEPDPEPNQNQN